jgi:hypothetical protein
LAVNHSHIVPAGYLRQFALPDEQIRIVLTQSGKEIPARTTVGNAGVRGGGQYKRERPDGSRSDDFETYTLQSIENDAVPILRELAARWPLSGEEKLVLAQFIGIQLVRGPKWFAWHKKHTTQNIHEYRADGAFEPLAQKHGVAEEVIFEANLKHALGSTQTLMQMAQLGAKLGCAIGSMSWTLVDFGKPALATSDHPVAVWPMNDHGRKAISIAPADVGIRNFLEVRFPVSPSSALLMTWRDLPDDPRPVSGRAHHALNFNAFTVAESEKQWFYRPGSPRPRIRDGLWLPLCAELVEGYSTVAAASSRLYREVMSDLQARSGDGSLKIEISCIPQHGDSLAEAA